MTNPFYVVASGSMIPELQVYDVLVVQGRIPFEDLEIGDIIVFDRPSDHDRVIVHRIVSEIDDDPRTLRTQGDANRAPIPGTDFPITEVEYIGKVEYVIPEVGYVTQALKPPVNYIIIAIIIGIMISKQFLGRGSKNAIEKTDIGQDTEYVDSTDTNETLKDKEEENDNDNTAGVTGEDTSTQKKRKQKQEDTAGVTGEDTSTQKKRKQKQEDTAGVTGEDTSTQKKRKQKQEDTAGVTGEDTSTQKKRKQKQEDTAGVTGEDTSTQKKRKQKQEDTAGVTGEDTSTQKKRKQKQEDASYYIGDSAFDKTSSAAKDTQQDDAVEGDIDDIDDIDSEYDDDDVYSDHNTSKDKRQ